MANQNNGGRSNISSDEQRPSWRPQDQGSMRDDRDDERSSLMSDRDRGRRDQQDEGYRMAERYGQGQSGYGAGRYGEDRSLGFENRNQGYGGRFDDRQQQGMGMDDRFTGRGGQGYYQGVGGQGGREGYGRQEEGLGQRGFGGGDRGFGGAENRGYSSGYNMGGMGMGGGFNQQTSMNPMGGQPMGGYGGHGDVRGSEGRGEGYGQQGMGRVGGYGQGSSGSYGGSSVGQFGNRSGQWGQGNQGGYGGYGQNISGGMQGGYGQQGSTQSGFGQEMRGPHRGKGPQGWQRSDERIREMICETLTDDDNIDASNIEIKVSSGEVTLTGSVPDRQTKRLAEDIVERMSGVKDVTNQLKVGRDHERSNQPASRGVGKDSETPGSSKHRA